MNKSDNKRIVSLDYLRGLAALSIMLYHFITLIYGELTAETLLGKLGVFSVSIFYILSGLTLCVVYQNKLKNVNSIVKFFYKRFIRIYPLMILITIVLIIFSSTSHSLQKIVLNITGLFGFFDPDGYIVSGLWSIGNELVFYSLFPIMIYLYAKGKKIFVCFFLLTVVIAFYITSYLINDSQTLSSEWHIYVNPFNQLYFFSGGMVLVAIKKTKIPLPALIITLFVLSILFYFLPAEEDKISLVTGWNRGIMSIFIFLFTWFIYSNDILFPSFIDRILRFLGDVSYSIYLWHSVVYLVLIKLPFISINKELLFTCSVICSLFISYLSYNFYEKGAMKFANKFFYRKT